MSDILDQFIDKKKADSVFISLGDGESVRVKELLAVSMEKVAGYTGGIKDALRLICVVDTSEGEKTKQFDNSTQRFGQELKDKKVKIGSSFTITRTGMQSKTRYIISDVVDKPTESAPTTTAKKEPVAA